MRRRAKVLSVGFVIAGAFALILLSTGAQPAVAAMGVADAKLQASALAGQEVTVRGTVVEGTMLESGSRLLEFVIADPAERMRVLFNETTPDNFGVKEVVVTGELVLQDDGVPYLMAREIKVGCASKY